MFGRVDGVEGGSNLTGLEPGSDLTAKGGAVADAGSIAFALPLPFEEALSTGAARLLPGLTIQSRRLAPLETGCGVAVLTTLLLDEVRGATAVGRLLDEALLGDARLLDAIPVVRCTFWTTPERWALLK